ncbi:MAG: lytic transglycosylase domain-containing protein [Treponema sp.]|nr:lytic transglycosylase domain-containing protein [Treponema sp.]
MFDLIVSVTLISLFQVLLFVFHHAKTRFLLLLLLCVVLSCKSEERADIPSPQFSAAFYEALLIRSHIINGTEADVRELFETSLKSASPRIREEAARELIPIVLRDKETNIRVANIEPDLYGAILYTRNRWKETLQVLKDADSSWSKALSAVAQYREEEHKDALVDLLMDAPIDSAYVWALETIEAENIPLSELELAAIYGRRAAARSSFSEALKHFHVLIVQNPRLFWRYPALLNDLGRSFQYSSIPEGVTILLQWESLLQSEAVSESLLDVPTLRYRLRYFLGRLERQRAHYEEAEDYFRAALLLAPDAEQEDACIWYILNMALTNKPETLATLLTLYQRRWHDDAYFEDILSPYCRYLTATRQWTIMLETFLRIRNGSDRALVAQYAYILGRVLDEGFLTIKDAAPALSALNLGAETTADALKQAFYRIAFEESQASLYYRTLSASRLGLALELALAQDVATEAAMSEEFQFLIGFFDAGAGSLVLPYLNRLRDTLSIAELRRIAEAFAADEQWIESIRIAGFYMNRQDYVMSRADMELYYPRSFKDIIEDRALDLSLPPQLLYGLIRTESAFDANIASYAGAIGLTQLMPATALEEARRIARNGGPNYVENGKVNARDPVANVHIGASYLSSLIKSMGNPMLALLGYNGGPTRVRRLRNAEPALPIDLFLETISINETRNYGKRVSAAAAMYGYLYFNLSMTAVVADMFR